MSISVKRLLAGIVDFYILCFASTLIVAIITLGKFDMTPTTLAVYLITALLILIFQDLLFGNASLGKRIFKIHIAVEGGERLPILCLIKRNLPKVLAPIELLLILTNSQRLGDMWSQTTIVNDE